MEKLLHFSHLVPVSVKEVHAIHLIELILSSKINIVVQGKHMMSFRDSNISNQNIWLCK